jgi:hypothetical protein
MPPAAGTPRGSTATVVVAVLSGALLVSIALWRPARIVAGMFVVVLVWTWWWSQRRMRGQAATRAGEGIGTFARAFDRHRPDFDPLVVRAVWDALQPYRTFRGGAAPLRPTDELGAFIDLGDLDSVILDEVAERTGRTLDNLPANPRYGQIKTVADLVEFFWQQPRGQVDSVIANADRG